MAAPIGALVAAEHSERVKQEALGRSDGTPGQVLELQHFPVLEADEDEYLEVAPAEGRALGALAAARLVRREPPPGHALLARPGQRGDRARPGDPGGGRLLAAIRGGAAQGLVAPVLPLPPWRRSAGNLAPGTLKVLKTAIPGVVSVTNPRSALGGVDAESLESAQDAGDDGDSHQLPSGHCRRLRVPLRRGVIAHRARRLRAAGADGAIRVHVLPVAEPADRQLSLAELTPEADLLEEVALYLDERRLIGTNVQLLPVQLRG